MLRLLLGSIFLAIPAQSLRAAEPLLDWPHFCGPAHNSHALDADALDKLPASANAKNALKCVNFADGKSVRSKSGFGKGGLVAAGKRLLVLTEKGEMVVAEANPTSYKELAGGQVLSGKCWTAPTLCGGRAYARHAAGDVVCVELKARP